MITANVVALGATAQVAAAAIPEYVPVVKDNAQEYFLDLAFLASLKLISLFTGGTK